MGVADASVISKATQKLCAEAWQGDVLMVPQLQQVAAAVNHSVIGASKVLRFVNPTTYPIRDRRVYRFYYRMPEDLLAAGHLY